MGKAHVTGSREVGGGRMMSDIPVLDLGQISLRKETNNWFSGNASRQLADKLYKAFSTVGFVYIKNHGIPQDKVKFRPGFLYFQSLLVDVLCRAQAQLLTKIIWHLRGVRMAVW